MEKNITCQICGKMFSKMGYNSHYWRTHGEGKGFGPTRGMSLPAWNKGLTKETDERVAHGAKTYGKSYKDGTVKVWSKGLTKESDPRIAKTSEKLSEVISEKIRNHTWHNSFSKSRTHTYNGQNFYGTWEVRYAMWLDSQGIKWIKNTKRFPYFFGGKNRSYQPDFYLVDSQCYVEIKGYKTPKDIAKWNAFPSNELLLVLKGEHLQSIGIDISVRKTHG